MAFKISRAGSGVAIIVALFCASVSRYAVESKPQESDTSTAAKNQHSSRLTADQKNAKFLHTGEQKQLTDSVEPVPSRLSSEHRFGNMRAFTEAKEGNSVDGESNLLEHPLEGKHRARYMGEEAVQTVKNKFNEKTGELAWWYLKNKYLRK